MAAFVFLNSFVPVMAIIRTAKTAREYAEGAKISPRLGAVRIFEPSDRVAKIVVDQSKNEFKIPPYDPNTFGRFFTQSDWNALFSYINELMGHAPGVAASRAADPPKPKEESSGAMKTVGKVFNGILGRSRIAKRIGLVEEDRFPSVQSQIEEFLMQCNLPRSVQFILGANPGTYSGFIEVIYRID